MPTVRITLAVALLSALAVALSSAAAALASTARSSNWAGYASHRPGLLFKKVRAEWTQPSATCSAGLPTYSSLWVGLGGYSENSNALEQIGSEVDCNAGGQVVSSAWYELVPAPAHTLSLVVAPGDLLKASVTVVGHRVTVALHDLTRGTGFTRIVHDSTLDLSSADWIVEAPSECQNPTFCRLLPLADFGIATFTHAQAISAKGHVGAISDRKWDTTRVTLASSGRHFISTSAGAAGVRAAPSPLSANGSSFTVTYSSLAAAATASAAQGHAPTSTTLVRPGLDRR
jgi:hypothetical protein